MKIDKVEFVDDEVIFTDEKSGDTQILVGKAPLRLSNEDIEETFLYEEVEWLVDQTDDKCYGYILNGEKVIFGQDNI